MRKMFWKVATFLFTVGVIVAQDGGAKDPEIGVRAPSTFVNCECQCERQNFRFRGKPVGNCLSSDHTGANFCFISRRSVRACRDTQAADPSIVGNQARRLFISYEACTTPPYEQCLSANPGGQNNFGDGDFNQGGFGSEGGNRGQFGFQFNPNGGLTFNLGNLFGLNNRGQGSDPRPSLASILGTRAAPPEESSSGQK